MKYFLNKNGTARKDEKSLMHTFYTTRYDYLRIAKAMLDDWQNNTCVGKYLKTIHERRIPKNSSHPYLSSLAFSTGYAGFFNTSYKGMENRPVMSMDGYGGQKITIDFERKRIISTQAIHENIDFPIPNNYDYKKIVYERIKNGKPASTSIVKQTAEPTIDPEQIILDNKARQEAQKKAKEYWDNFYKNIFKGVSGSSWISEKEKNNFGSSMISEEEKDKIESEKNKLFKNIETSNTFDGYYGFTNMKPPMTSLGGGTLEINNGIVTILDFWIVYFITFQFHQAIIKLLFLPGCVSIINIFCLFACNYRSLVQNIVWFFNKK